jgi:hypothetical protein
MRVVVPKKLKSLVKNTGGLDEPVKDRFLAYDAKMVIPNRYEVIYDNYGVDTKTGKPVFKQLVKNVDAESDDEDTEDVLATSQSEYTSIHDNTNTGRSNDKTPSPQVVDINESSVMEPNSRVLKPTVAQINSMEPIDQNQYSKQDEIEE